MSFGFGLGFPKNRPFAGGPSLNFQFVGSTTLDSSITFTRGSNATQFDSSGNLVYAPNNAIRNNTMVGAVAGTPGTLPTNWQRFLAGTAATAVVGTGTENGITYVDITFSGGNTDSISFFMDGTLGHAALNGQTWTGSAYYKLTAGSFTNCTALQAVYEANAAGTSLAVSSTSITTVTGAALSSQRIATTRANNNASTAEEQLTLQITGTGAFSFTLRIGLPQLEIGPTATAVNRTSGTAYYGPRFDYNPATLAAQGLLIEEQRTNSIRNNTMQGAVAGTPGTAPTNWAASTGAGITRELIGVGVESGITYIDYRFSGTGSVVNDTQFDQSNIIAAASGQTWAHSIYCKVIAGSLNNITLTQILSENSAAGGFLASSTQNITPTSAALGTQRFALTRTLNNASTAFTAASLRVQSTGAINITLRIGLPQLERGAFATSVIPTTTTAATRNADVASVNTLSPWFNSASGTLFAQGILVGGTAATFPYPAALVGSNANNDSIGITWRANTLEMRFGVRVGATSQGDFGMGPNKTAGSSFKVAGRYAVNDLQAASDGVLGAGDTSASLPTVTSLSLGGPVAFQVTASVWLQRVTFYPRGLSNAELQAITA